MEICFAILQQVSARFHLLRLCPTVVAVEAGSCRFDNSSPPFGLPTFDRFPQFSALPRFAEQVLPLCCRKLQKAIKVGHHSVPAVRVRALAIICDNQSDTYALSAPRHKRKTTDARPRGMAVAVLVYRIDASRHPSGEPNYCGRASAAFCLDYYIKGLCAPCRLSRITARARTRKAGTERWPVCAILEIQAP